MRSAPGTSSSRHSVRWLAASSWRTSSCGTYPARSTPSASVPSNASSSVSTTRPDEPQPERPGDLRAPLVQEADGAEQSSRARQREDRACVGDDEAVVRRRGEGIREVVRVVAVGDREDAAGVDEREANEEVVAKLVRRRHDGVRLPQESGLQRIAENAREARPRHLVARCAACSIRRGSRAPRRPALRARAARAGTARRADR